MQRWEYLVRVFELNKDDEVVVDYVTQTYPDRSWKALPEYDPLTLEAWLNQAGQEGWELVKVEGVNALGKKGDVGRIYPPASPGWDHYYLCVFKRLRST